MNRKGETYYQIIKGSDELLFDELHIIYFKDDTRTDCIRYRLEIPKETLNYNSEFEKILSSFIKNVVAFENNKIEKIGIPEYNG